MHNGHYLFFQKKNEVLNKYLQEQGIVKDENESYSFNPFHFHNENRGHKFGIANVLGKKFAEERTSSCEYHLQDSVKRRSKCVKDVSNYSALLNGIKNATAKLEYEEKNNCRMSLSATSHCMVEKSWKVLWDFWDGRKFRLDFPFLPSIHNIPQSSLV